MRLLVFLSALLPAIVLGQTATVSWGPVDVDNDGNAFDGVFSYRIYVDGVNTVTVQDDGSASYSRQLSGLLAGDRAISIEACTSTGACGNMAPSVTVTVTSGVPGDVPNFTVTVP